MESGRKNTEQRIEKNDEIRKKFFLENIVSQLLGSVLPITLVCIAFITITFFSMQELSKSSAQNMLLHEKNIVDEVAHVAEYQGITLSNNPSIVIQMKLMLMMRQGPHTYSDYRRIRDVLNTLESNRDAYKYADAIYICFEGVEDQYLSSQPTGFPYAAQTDREWLNWIIDSSEPRQRMIISDASDDGRFPGKDGLSTYVLRIGLQESTVKTGYVVVNIKRSMIEREFSKLDNPMNSLLIVTNDKQEIVVGNDEFYRLSWTDETIEGLIATKRYHVLQEQVDDSIIYCYVLTPYQSIYQLSLLMLLASLLCVSIAVAVALFFSIRKTDLEYRNLRYILDLIANKTGEKIIPQEYDGNGNLYSRVYNSLMKTVVEYESAQVHLANNKVKTSILEMQALQAQINPHFLYNTLDSIYWKTISYTGKPNEASNMILGLSSLLRYALENPGDDVSIDEELRSIQAYIDIQKNRLGDRISYSQQVQGVILSCRIPRLILQPLIENSIQHARATDRQLKMRIKICDEGDTVRIRALDNGVGIDSAKLRTLQEQSKEDKLEGYNNSIGLMNTWRRVQLRYGANSSLHIFSKPQFGTCIEINIPKSKKENELG